MTLTVYMFGYTVSMLVSGPLSDFLGQKRILICGIGLYIAATIACAFSTSITFLIISRFFQAIGGCCGTVIARVMVKENYKQEEQIVMLAHLSTAMAVCPLFIPLVGGVMQTYFGWRSGFYLLSLLAILLIILSMNQIPQLSSSKKSDFSFKSLLRNYYSVISNRLFIGYSITIGLAWCNYFAFTLESSFILQKTLGFSSIVFGILFTVPIVGYVLGTQLTKRFANQVGWDQLIFIATILCLMGSLLIFSLNAFLPLSGINIVIPMAIIMIGVGIIIPCTQAAVMQPFPSLAGTASGLFFFIQMLFGSVCGLILQAFRNNTATPLCIVLVISSLLLVFAFYRLIIARESFLAWMTK